MRVSRWLLLCGGLSHILAGVAVLICGLSCWLKIVLIAALVVSSIRLFYRYADRHSAAFISAIAYIDGRWHLESGDGAVAHGQIISSYVHPILIVVNFQLDNGRWQALTLCPDAADSNALRRLRVWLSSHKSELTTPP